ncbi:MAG: oligopeptide/dipeptide ABC transporter ATP-binding protein [Pyramidobacter porci]|uniref:ABC transporter ATP-binding protein n=1 Tax=Pyramidobacter porci TaxID=2605789 RepID=UPI002A75014A|nr:oligopeptide/dipeptide ABC transporter ATP-binding protein [Pyramidobacter porci]MDY2648693.1 oligopeptide/dipeptide ABC transporter ATP-binding protein [Pyramidobacter porci]
MNIVEVKDLRMCFPILKGVLFHSVAGYVKAVDGVSFSIPEGETLGLVGESGSGKSTVGNMLLRLLKPTSGEILYRGRSILGLSPQEEREFRSRAQMVFQNPFASLNPRMIVGDIIGRVLRVQRPELKRDEVRDLVLNGMQEVGLKVEHMTRYPHEFSGGQRQRIAIARALISSPEFVVLDEPTSALDVSVQAQILNLFKDIQKKRHLSYLFISHNLSVIRHISHRIAVMYLGSLMEFCDRQELFRNPLHPYTQALLRSIPKPYVTGEDISDKIIKGDIPSPIDPPAGCRFNTRCPQATDECRSVRPQWREARDGHWVACHQV